jgi:hypothetical protein
MKIFNIFSRDKVDEEVLFVEDKFSIVALFFQFLWLLYHKVWMKALIILVIQAMLMFAVKRGIIVEQLSNQLNMVMAFIVAVFAKSWYMSALIKRDYRFLGVMAAKDLDEAKYRYYQENEDNVRQE